MEVHQVSGSSSDLRLGLELKAYPSLSGGTSEPVWRSYYYAGDQREAVREQQGASNHLFFLLTDHLGSTSVVTDEAGVKAAEQRYKPWGEPLQ